MALLFFKDVEGGSPESLAVTNHVGLIGQTVTDQIPLVKMDPNQHPMDQFNGTLETVTKLKDEAARLWEAITKIVEASQKRSGKCHALRAQTVIRTTEATHAESEDAEQSAKDEMLSMADRLSIENQQFDRQIAAMTTKIGALEEELYQAAQKSPQSSPRGKEQQ